jgi:hypothetical protein
MKSDIDIKPSENLHIYKLSKYIATQLHIIIFKCGRSNFFLTLHITIYTFSEDIQNRLEIPFEISLRDRHTAAG